MINRNMIPLVTTDSPAGGGAGLVAQRRGQGFPEFPQDSQGFPKHFQAKMKDEPKVR